MRHSSVFWGVLGFLALAVGCSDTAEGEPGCATGLIDCDGTCVDPATDDTFCGASGDCQGDNAGTTCASGESCDGGMCALSCESGLIDCDGTCVDPATDNTFCGASGDCQGDNAGTTCASGESCDGGMCALSCEAGMIDCDGTCVDPATDDTYCGASGDCQGDNAGTTCAGGEACADSICGPSLSCTTVNDVQACTNGAISQIDLGMISATECHDQCPHYMVENGMSSGCWVLALDLNCYCRSGSIITGGSHTGGTCN